GRNGCCAGKLRETLDCPLAEREMKTMPGDDAMSDTNGNVKTALKYADEHFNDFRETLIGLSRIPSGSAEGFPPADVRRSAEAMADALRDAGVEKVQVLEIPGVHPYVYGEWLHKPGAPTILLYGHHDVQPPGRPEKWLSPAFEPTERAG